MVSNCMLNHGSMFRLRFYYQDSVYESMCIVRSVVGNRIRVILQTVAILVAILDFLVMP